jgi:GLPGLI family protein
LEKQKYKTMKKHLLLVTLVFVFCLGKMNVKAQQIEGKVKYLTTFDWVKMINMCDYLDKSQKEKSAYMWGNRSEWKIYDNLYFSQRQSKYEESDEKVKDDQEDDTYAWRKDVFFITRNFEKNTFFNADEMLGKVYLVSDSLKAPDWKILNDLKEVAGHVCMNASLNDTLRKQKIIAWFALDIPVQAGPDRFYGLPGLILEVSINNGAKIMTADKLEFKTLTTEFDLPKKLKGKQMNHAAYLGVIKKFMDDKRKAEEFPWGIRY